MYFTVLQRAIFFFQSSSADCSLSGVCASTILANASLPISGYVGTNKFLASDANFVEKENKSSPSSRGWP
eukprot:m.172657 g.172657  ORF g.172657 m.172657 type:complete len:70 (+) comp21284_c0_seq3:99-308(+)